MSRRRPRVVDIQVAQKNLEELIDALKPGEWLIIAVNGEHKVKVIALTEEEKQRLSRREM